MNSSGYVVISCDVLPEIFAKVIEVKKLIACGDEKSSAAACKKVGISRSAFYKYRDSVFTYEEKMTQQIITLFIILKDEPGVLSSVLTAIHKHGGNVMTLNQSIPVDGAASVTLTVKINGEELSPSEFKPTLSEIEGVVDVRLLSGE